MAVSMAPVLAQMQTAFEKLAEAAVRARRAKADVEQAREIYKRLAKGATAPEIHRAIAEVQIAADKCRRYANLLDATRGHYQAYFKIVAPGWRFSDADGMPDGQRLGEEALAQESRAEQMHRKLVNSVGDKEGDIRQAEQVARETVSALKDLVRPGDTHASTGVQGATLPAQPGVQDSQHPVADVVIALTGVAMATHVWIKKFRNSKARKRDGD
ncbi:hypothetical protein ACN27F_21630 [Solwaraspora sp. WMMB335]|uniref:hypothetical protein n=1 Tax=Solwaraspora sp. WMMB335 TaxID=3404118 RepID=UPI003B962BF1